MRNFKAVKDTGVLRLGGLTVFIGDNGTGKSSVLEALRLMTALSQDTLDRALEPFGSYEDVRWKGGKNLGRVTPDAPWKEYHPVEITVRGHVRGKPARAMTRLSGQNRNEVVFEHEELSVGSSWYERTPKKLRSDRSLLGAMNWFDDWQFVDMAPERMRWPARRARSGASVRLAHDGHNLAEYLPDLRDVPEHGADALNALLEALQVILPYARGLDPEVRDVFDRQVALRLSEGRGRASFTVPGWMLSTGTLRLIALLALLRHPRPPSVLCVEEIENGLDPRTIHLVINELISASDAGRTQIMVTTHSPYLLDLVPLTSLVLVEREAGEPPTFDRPANHKEVREWAQRFAPGELYTMGTLRRRRGDR